MQQEKKTNLHKAYHRRELFIRYPIIVLVGILMPMIYDDYEYFTRDYYIAVVVSILRTAALWLGSKKIVEFILSRLDFLKQTAKTLSIQAISLIIYTCIIIAIEIYILEQYSTYRYTAREKFIFYENAIIITLFITTIYASTFFFLKWKENLLRAEKLEKATLEAKYETLKNQVNPHFLFNSLNTLTGMLDEGSATQTYVQNLSDFLRYVLQTKDKEVVLLRDEIEFSKQYAFIQQKRFDKKLSIDFDVHESSFHFALPPLSLQMLIENAIKHNIISKEKPLYIKIYIRKDNYLMVENNLQRKTVEDSTGLGLENIRNRYRYLGVMNIEIIETEHIFKVGLPLLKVSL